MTRTSPRIFLIGLMVLPLVLPAVFGVSATSEAAPPAAGARPPAAASAKKPGAVPATAGKIPPRPPAPARKKLPGVAGTVAPPSSANAASAAQNLSTSLGVGGAGAGGGGSAGGAAPSGMGQKPLEIRGQVRRLNMSLVLKNRSGDIDFVKERKNYREEIMAQTMK